MPVDTREQEQRQEYEYLFHQADLDEDGFLDQNELEALLDAMGVDVTPEELSKGWRELDMDGDGRIDLAEFVRWWRLQ